MQFKSLKFCFQNQNQIYLSLFLMDSNGSADFFLNHSSALHSVYCHSKGEDEIIDLGLSLRTLQPEATFHHPPPENLGSLERFTDELNWARSNMYLKNSNTINSSCSNPQQDCEEETEVVQSKQRWAYVKVNMDGVIVGRKVCIFELGCYSSLALQLEDMFGRLSESGLKLFENESEFSLFYKDGDENWRSVGDVPWKQFVECVKRLRIARKEEAFAFIHQN